MGFILWCVLIIILLLQSIGLGALGVGSIATGYYVMLLSADELELHPPSYPWSHNGLIDAVDHAR